MHPPFDLTTRIVGLVASVAEKMGRARGEHLDRPAVQLRRRNRIRTVRASLAIEGNTLTEKQITALIEHKRVAGPAHDVREVLNALQVYEAIAQFDPYSLDDFRRAHTLLMEGLVDDAGGFRRGAVGIAKGDHVTHIAPPADRVPGLLRDLFTWLRTSEDHILLKSCVAHYEIEFIHPFTDGNGRMGRLWQSVLLRADHPVIEHVPVETIIKERQADYYAALEHADALGRSTPFIEFSLAALDEALDRLLDAQPPHRTPQDRMRAFLDAHGPGWFVRADYLALERTISTATATRDLTSAVKDGVLERTGTGRATRYRRASRNLKM